MQHDKIEQLKRLTSEKEADFSVVMGHFFDIVETPIVLERSTPLTQQNDFFRAVLTPVAQYCGHGLTVSSLRLMQLKKSHFIHGTAQLSNGMLIVLYFFDDIQTGMAISGGANGTSNFFRLTAFQPQDKNTPAPDSIAILSPISRAYN